MKTFCSRWIAAAVALAIYSSATAPAQPRVSDAVSAELDSLVQLYTYLHRHPELSFREKGTAAKLVSELKPLGFDVTPDVGGNGFVAVMKNGPGPTVMVRTDLDALPVVENTGRPYASDVRTTDEYGNDVGVMHACGHDIHMASFIGTAERRAC
jgi:hippurate hydrolase